LWRKGLEATAARWPEVREGFCFLHQAARILGNPANRTGAQVRRQLRRLLGQMRDAAATARTAKQPKLASALDHFVKVTGSYEPGLFHCYTVADLPRTNNALEQFFGSHRYHERRCSGRKRGSPTRVVRGAVRVVAALATRQTETTGEELAPPDVAVWRTQRAKLQRHRAAGWARGSPPGPPTDPYLPN
jgi:hypothetical protein